MISGITITGADDSIQPGELLQLSRKYPRTEWGILVGDNYYGLPRFPSIEWIDYLDLIYVGHEDVLNLSLHACGNTYVKGFIEGKNTRLFDDLANYVGSFGRIQLNTHNVKHKFNGTFAKAVQLINRPTTEFIFQYDNANGKLVEELARSFPEIKCSLLFDKSGGIGKLPESWPTPIEGIKCGMAGGLGPNNLVEQIEKIEKVVGDIPVWIDMETHVRSEDNQQFDLDKVEQCLEIAHNYIV